MAPENQWSVLEHYAYYAQRIIEEHLAEKLQQHGPIIPPTPPTSSSEATKNLLPKNKNPVGIIGAGVGGLYTALMLQSLGIPYQILEASSRVGGRLYTYPFPKGQSYDYFDVGAMRFPDIPVMRRTFHLFRETLKDEINLFQYNINHSYLNYNGKTVRRSSALPESTADTFGFAKTGADSAHYVGHRSYGDILDAVIDPFVDALEKDISTYPATHDGWDKLMASDAYSTRGYLATQKVPLDSQNPNLDQLTIDWLETMDKSTGWYDRSFAETVLEQMCFAKNNKDAKWWCEDGGSSKIAEAMASLLETRPTLNTQVTKIEANSTLGVDPPGMTVTVAGGGQFDFSHVVSTLPLPVLRTLDIDNVGLTVKQTNALRQLQYGPAEKIGVLFSSQWWNDNKVISKIDNQPINIQGGQSSTDRCIRTVVYPSYGPNGSSSSNALIASYGWTADATRFAGLFGNDDASKARLKDLVLRDLAAVHGVDQKVLEAVFVDIYPWEWSQSPFAQGAYAFFGPGQFSELYRCLTKPIAKGSFHIAGEAISPRHAWVVGALDSAWRAVYSIVLRDYPELKDKFKDLWGQNMEWTASPTFQKVYTHEDLLAVHLAIHAPDVYKL